MIKIIDFTQFTRLAEGLARKPGDQLTSDEQFAIALLAGVAIESEPGDQPGSYRLVTAKKIGIQKDGMKFIVLVER